MFLLILSADFELGAECLPSGGLRLPGIATLGVLGLSFRAVISISWHDMVI